MTDDARPDPLVPAEVDLRDFQYMELDVQKLRDSRFAAEVSAEAFRAGLLLWCASWHQVPAASLPDNDTELSNLAGFGRVVKEWRKVRDEALSLFVRCSDGRLYHPVIAEKAIAAWDAKLRHQYDRLCDRIRKDNKRRADNKQPLIIVPSFDDWKSGGKPAEVPPEHPIPSDGNPPENALRGNGEGTEQKEERETASLAGARTHEDDPPEVNGHAPTDAGLACRAMRQAGFAATNPGDPRLLTLLAQGATIEEFCGVAAEAVKGQKGWAWILKTVENRRNEASSIALKPARVTPKAWEGAT